MVEDLTDRHAAIAIRQTQRPGGAAGLAADDQILAWALSTSWASATGPTSRRARHDPSGR